MIRQAVIMAGGLGSRLKGRTTDMPKGFIPVPDVPMVEQSVRKLISYGIEEIIIGTGHHAEWYDRLAEKYTCIKTVMNKDYANTGSMGTLAVCEPYVNGDFILLESDLLYDSIGLGVLINDPSGDVILASGPTRSGDEVYLQTDDAGNLVKHSKKRDEITEVAGELTGLTKLRKETLVRMVEYMNREKNSQPRMEYEVAMTAVSNEGPGIKVRTVQHYVWCEVDDEHHLERALNIICPHIAENESLRSVRREVLLNPGPATTTDSVKYAQVQADVCPREQEFGDVMQWISDELSLMAGSPGSVETVLFGGSGTAGDEAMISSCVPDGGKLLILDNGAYGARMAKIASVYGICYDTYKSDGISKPDTEEIKKILTDGGYTHFAIVYHETTTGLLNPVPELCRFCHSVGITTIVDAVSAFCAVPIDMDADCIDFMASTSNKNIQGMAGVAFVFCRKEALEKIKGYRRRNFYLSVYDQYEYFVRTHQTRFTPPVQTMYALRQAIIETKLETIEGRYNRYTECWNILVNGINRLGLKMPVPTEDQSHLIVTIEDPSSPNYRFNDLHALARSHGFTIYPGKLSNAATFRIANIGDIRPDEMDRFISVLESYIKELY